MVDGGTDDQPVHGPADTGNISGAWITRTGYRSPNELTRRAMQVSRRCPISFNTLATSTRVLRTDTACRLAVTR
jgi:hypothetical protein